LSLDGFPDAQITRLSGSQAASWLAAAMTHSIWAYHRLAHEAAARAIAADPDLALAHLFRARSAAELRDFETMLDALDRGLELAPDSVALNRQRGEAAMSMGQLPKAVAHFRKVLAVADDAGAALRLGLVADRLGEDAQAEAAYERLIRIEPENFLGYNQLAWFLAERERELDRALDLARRADSLRPGNASIQDTLGWILHLQGESEAAAPHLRRAFEIAGWEIPGIGFHLAQVELAIGNTEAARELFETLAARPKDAPHARAAREMLGRL